MLYDKEKFESQVKRVRLEIFCIFVTVIKSQELQPEMREIRHILTSLPWKWHAARNISVPLKT